MGNHIPAIVLGVVFAIAICASLYMDYVSRPVHARTAGFHVVIDAGHGGRDGGASSPNGVSERDINLAIARHLETEFRLQGVGVTMTRTNADSLANPLARNKKRSDMAARRAIIERVKPDLVVSIHLNSLPSHPGVRGLQTFFNPRNEQSKVFAEAIQKQFNTSNLDINRRAASGDFYLLDCTNFPSVLVECGFLSNPTEERLLQCREYQIILARTIAEAVLLTK